MVNTVIGTPIDATTAYANASLQDLLKPSRTLPRRDLWAPEAAVRRHEGLRDRDRLRSVSSSQSTMQTEVKNIGTSWTLSSGDARRTVGWPSAAPPAPLLSAAVLDLGAPDPTADPWAVTRRDCPFEDDGGE